MKPLTVIILVVSIFFGGLLISISFGLFDVLPMPVTAGIKLSAEEIKGSITLNDVLP